MTIYKIKDCYYEDKLIGTILPYSTNIGIIKCYGVIGYLKYIFINSSLTKNTANKKLIKHNNRIAKKIGL